MIQVPKNRAAQYGELLPSEQKFGLFFALVFTFFGFYCRHKYWPETVSAAFFVASGLFLAVALVAPKFLTPLNRAWFALGVLLGKIVSPIVLGVIFFLLITPVAIVTRFLGRDELRLNKQNVDSYWVHRNPVVMDVKSFHNQF